ncbi:MAG: DNA gyrase subunit A [Clostridiales bacterium]|nr:DNA gyrase subunit A [Clostridiales bacterium]
MAHDDYDYSSHENQAIMNVGIEKEIKTSYIEYAMSVIVGRALPDVRDGLKPVHRRILYAMYDDHLTYDKPFRKSATTVGNVLGHYHPHGDGAVYDALVRLAQPFSMRYPLVEGHGNFGNIDGDGAAAYRYTEARMAKLANVMLQDIDKDVVDMVPNFDNKLLEPVCLPSRYPNLLVNGSIGIAVGMATNIPPHNMCEVIDATDYLMDHPDCTVKDLMQFVKGPDFPTYGTIHGTAGIYEAYMTGRGRIKVRAKCHFEEKHGKTSIIVTELPYQVNRSMLLEYMAQLVKDKRIEGISDIRNESGRDGMRIVIDLKKDVNRDVVLNLLYKYTQLEDTCAINMLALVNGEPKTLGLKELLSHYVEFQKSVVTRRVKFDLAKAEREAHIFEGYKIAIDNIDEVIQIIRSSESIPDSKVRLMERFALSDIQAQAIVDMTLGKLSGLERQKIENRLAVLYGMIDEYRAILSDEGRIIQIIKDDMAEIRSKYGDERRTTIEEAESEILIEDLIEREICVITATHDGYVKRLPSDTYSSQRRGGKGITAMATKDEDFVEDVIISHSHEYLLFFSNLGRMYFKKCYEVPEASRTAKGTNLVNVLSLAENEKITAIIPVAGFDDDKYIVLLTRLGVIKRVKLTDYRTRRTTGLYAINLDEGDNLLYVMLTDGNDDIICATRKGMSVRFSENDVRCMGRQARGVRAVTLTGDDYIVGAAAIPENHDDDVKLLTVTAGGYGKRTDISEYTLQKRGGKGMICHRVTGKTGPLCGIALVWPEDDIMLITDSGIIIRTAVGEIPVYGRAASGVIVMRTGDGASIARFARVKPDPDTDTADGEAEYAAEDETDGTAAAGTEEE